MPRTGARKVIHGILNVHKPVGMSSSAVVTRVKRCSGAQKVGHGGTLDPLASGVLPVLLGHACRLQEYVMQSEKEYITTMELGVCTDSYDRDGKVTETRDPSGVVQEDIEAVLRRYRGTVQQVPPMFSALKRGGKPLYRLAREGQVVAREPRDVEVGSVRLSEIASPRVTIHITCGKGFYVRSLVHDVGQQLGCGAYVTDLARTRTGRFQLSDAVGLEELERLFAKPGDEWRKKLLRPDVLLEGVMDRVQGNVVPMPRLHPACLQSPLPLQYYRMYCADELVAIMSYERSGRTKFEKTFEYSEQP